MKLFKLIIIALFFYMFFNSANSISVDDVVTMAIDEVKPHHCVFWKLFRGSDATREYFVNDQMKSILSNLLNKVPTALIDFSDPQPFMLYNGDMSRDNNIFYKYNINISAPMHIFFSDPDLFKLKNNFEQYFSLLLKLISDSIMYLSSPKCLYLMHQRSDSFLMIKDILIIAKNFGFVDFTIIQMIRDSPTSLYYYNVSSNSTEIQKNITRNLQLFPDKIKNMNGYNLRVGVYDTHWPIYYKNNTFLPFHLCVLLKLFKVYEHFSEFLNVTSIIIPVDHLRYTWEEIFIKYDLEMALDGNSVAQTNTAFLDAYIYRFETFIAVVPIIHYSKVSLSIKIIYSFLSIAGIIATVLIFFKYSRNSSEEWSFLLIFELMLGFTSRFQPQTLRSKIVYFILLMFSIFLASDIVTNLTAIHFESNERSLVNDIDDVFKKNISIVSGFRRNYVDYLMTISSDEKVQKIFNLSKFSHAYFVRENEIKICSELGAELELFSLSSHEIPDNFTIMDFNLPTLIYCIQFKSVSPFRLKFGESEARIKEFGLDLKWEPNLKVFKPDKKKIDISEDVGELIYSLKLVMAFGSLVSIIFFIFELAWKRMPKNHDEIFLKHYNAKNPKNIRKIKVV